MPWSHSKLKDYEICPYRLTLAETNTPRASNPYTDAGLLAHAAIEDYLKERTETLPPFPQFERDFILLRNSYAISEYKLAIDRQWRPCPWDDAWGRAILDATVVNRAYVRVIDFKTGKSGSIAHVDQGQTYALFVNASYPNTDITVEFWYLESGKRTTKTYTPDSLNPIRRRVTARAFRAEMDTKRVPRPNRHVCGYCPYANSCWYAPDDRIQS